ncbi:flagellar biosynthetic protein FliR [Actinoplanes bogorensis]|uniref:Flagellar biosynthetic protein FliR n=1 Tax=Paractinoplanes bogorensis TaxID=1610840 RepID=A0ABS5YJB0_9ACTN|nr:flagellar biosynthetic protein FliR [Actinoplanes bogorensis]MBU2663111.1 flagellar biosynthetic protein FliR [Actinoplanes bogorensis]
MNLSVPTAELLALMLGAARTGAWMMMCPPFNSRLIPGTVKALLSIGLTLPMFPYLRGTLPSLQTSDIIFSILIQVFVGAGLGFITAMLFAALQAAGDMIDVFGGFTLAMGYDPLSQNQSSIFGRFYNLVAVTLLFATDGHQLVLRGFLQTFKTVPLNWTFDSGTFTELLLKGLGDLFVAAIQIAGPLIAVLFLTDVAFGLLNRVAPALNAFQLGFPAKIFLVLIVSSIAVTALPGVVDSIVKQAVNAVLHVSGT